MRQEEGEGGRSESTGDGGEGRKAEKERKNRRERERSVERRGEAEGTNPLLPGGRERAEALALWPPASPGWL